MTGRRDYHLNCPSGLAGDMFLGACLDLGMPLEVLSSSVEKLGLAGVTVEAKRASRGGVSGTRFRVLLDGRPVEGPDPDEAPDGVAAGTVDVPRRGPPAGSLEARSSHSHGVHEGRNLAAIRRLIDASGLEAPVKERATNLLVRLGEAEAKIHQVPVEEVHFHEIGAVDSIVDLVGAASAVEYLKPRRLTCGPVAVGSGEAITQHGRLPVPAPATAELLRGIPIVGAPGGELLTPTGAVLLAELVDKYGQLPSMVLTGIGYGLGRRILPDRPNAARLLEGEAQQPGGQVMIVECQIDDLPGEGFGFLLERLLEAGALDVFFTPVQMKKNRPGTLVTTLCHHDQLEPLAAVLLAESGSLGCRYYPVARFEAERESVKVATRFGEVRIKRARFQDRIVAEAPEYEDCRRLALEKNVSWHEVYREALASLGGQRSG